MFGEVSIGEVGIIKEGVVVNIKKWKFLSLGVIEDLIVGGSVFGGGYVNVWKIFKELFFFLNLFLDILYFFGFSV